MKIRGLVFVENNHKNIAPAKDCHHTYKPSVISDSQININVKKASATITEDSLIDSGFILPTWFKNQALASIVNDKKEKSNFDELST